MLAKYARVKVRDVYGQLQYPYNGMLLDEANGYRKPARIGHSRYFVYTAADNTLRCARIGKPYKVPPMREVIHG